MIAWDQFNAQNLVDRILVADGDDWRRHASIGPLPSDGSASAVWYKDGERDPLYLCRTSESSDRMWWGDSLNAIGFDDFEDALIGLMEAPKPILRPKTLPPMEVLQASPSSIERAIQEVILQEFDIKWSLVLSRTRTARIAAVRQIAMWLYRRYLGCSYPELGKMFNRDHTTVMWAARRIDEVLRTGVWGKGVWTMVSVEQIRHTDRLVWRVAHSRGARG